MPRARVAHGALHRQHAAFPGRVERRLVLLGHVLAAHVVNAIHRFAPLRCYFWPGLSGRPVPIMESRVTRSASFSSLQPSVPAGRIGSTMKRVSAVESQTRISVSFGSLMPKSSSTPRGSFTARERYGADLYHTGGRPRTSHG